MVKFSKAMFDPLIGQIFLLHKNDGTSIPLKLTSIDQREVIQNYESFSLNFEALNHPPALPDNSYVVENEQLGQQLLFLSATPSPDPDPTSYYYESVFNIYQGPGE